MMGKLHPLLPAYRLAWWLAQPLAQPFLARRAARGKEDPARIGERRGIAGLARPDGRLVWMHGASVGEGLALLPLVERMQALGFVVLVTTGTVTSANVLAARLPPGALHQFVPLDAGPFMRRFVDHWQPELVLLAESELWPNLLLAAKQRGIAVALVNARMSARSFRRWSRAKGFIRAVLGCVDLCLAQSTEDAGRFSALGAQRTEVCGNLKFDAAPLPVDAAALAALRQWIGERRCWIAASTHEGEETEILGAHSTLAMVFPDLLTIIAPRHPARGGAIAALGLGNGLQAARRSLGERSGAQTQIYVCDTLGELGLLYSLDAPVFIGKSLASGGGQNPIEAARLGSAILHGPAVGNFAEAFALLDAVGAARPVTDGWSLASELGVLLARASARDAMGQRGRLAMEAQRGAADAILRALAPVLAASAPDQSR